MEKYQMLVFRFPSKESSIEAFNLTSIRATFEINKIILSNEPSRGFKLLESTKLLHHFFRQITWL